MGLDDVISKDMAWASNRPFVQLWTFDSRLYVPVERDSTRVVEKLPARWSGSPNALWQVIPSSRKGCIALKSLALGQVVSSTSKSQMDFFRSEARWDEDIWEVSGTLQECVLHNWKHPNCYFVGFIDIISSPDCSGLYSVPLGYSKMESERLLLIAYIANLLRTVRCQRVAMTGFKAQLSIKERQKRRETSKIKHLEEECFQLKHSLSKAQHDSKEMSQENKILTSMLLEQSKRFQDVEMQLVAIRDGRDGQFPRSRPDQSFSSLLVDTASLSTDADADDASSIVQSSPPSTPQALPPRGLSEAVLSQNFLSLKGLSDMREPRFFSSASSVDSMSDLESLSRLSISSYSSSRNVWSSHSSDYPETSPAGSRRSSFMQELWTPHKIHNGLNHPNCSVCTKLKQVSPISRSTARMSPCPVPERANVGLASQLT